MCKQWLLGCNKEGTKRKFGATFICSTKEKWRDGLPHCLAINKLVTDGHNNKIIKAHNPLWVLDIQVLTASLLIKDHFETTLETYIIRINIHTSSLGKKKITYMHIFLVYLFEGKILVKSFSRKISCSILLKEFSCSNFLF